MEFYIPSPRGIYGSTKLSVPDNKCFQYNSGTIKNLSISASASNAGILAGNNSGTIENCTAVGSVSGTADYTGGFVGVNTGTITECSSETDVTGTKSAGGLVGSNSGSVSYSYYDKFTSGSTDTDKGTPLATAELQNQSYLEGWNFETVWALDPEAIHYILR